MLPVSEAPSLSLGGHLSSVSSLIPDFSLSLFFYPFGGLVISARASDRFLVCGSALGQIVENTGGPLHLWVRVLQFKIFLALWANPQSLSK